MPWLRLVARQSVDDPQVAADHDRAARIRLVPPEMLVASTDCDAGPLVEATRRRSSAAASSSFCCSAVAEKNKTWSQPCRCSETLHSRRCCAVE